MSLAIGWAVKHGVPLIARSGGHSAGGYSVTRGLMIDTKPMDDARYYSSTGIITIGGGTLNADVYQALREQGRTITHGRCPKVGAAGFLLGGGVGFNIRTLGVAIDALVGSQIVLADGEILDLSDMQNSDLFWACRGGGGGNFGINTSFSLQTYPVPHSVTSVRVTWNTHVDSVFPVLMDSLYASPTNLGTWTTLSAVTPQQFASGKDVSVYFEGQWVGPSAGLIEIIAPALTVAQPASMVVKEMDYWCTQETIFSDSPSPSDLQNCTIYFRGPISPAACAVVLKWLRQWPGTPMYANLSFLRTGGQANETTADATAFVHRDNDWLAVFYLKWHANADSAGSIHANLAWLNGFYSELAQFGIGEAYQNFLDPSLSDFLQQYYGSNLRRLQLIKDAVDPMGVFQFPQGIPASSWSGPSGLYDDTSDIVMNDPATHWPTPMRHAADHKQSLSAGRDAAHRPKRLALPSLEEINRRDGRKSLSRRRTRAINLRQGRKPLSRRSTREINPREGTKALSRRSLRVVSPQLGNKAPILGVVDKSLIEASIVTVNQHEHEKRDRQ